ANTAAGGASATPGGGVRARRTLLPGTEVDVATKRERCERCDRVNATPADYRAWADELPELPGNREAPVGTGKCWCAVMVCGGHGASRPGFGARMDCDAHAVNWRDRYRELAAAANATDLPHDQAVARVAAMHERDLHATRWEYGDTRTGPLSDDVIAIEARVQRDGSRLLAVWLRGMVYGRRGWEHEPIPSSRTDAYLRRTRYATWNEARAALTAAMEADHD
ncbi:MAG: hypothetical protein WC789_14510, partial [Lentisphaeria bacterium]